MTRLLLLTSFLAVFLIACDDGDDNGNASEGGSGNGTQAAGQGSGGPDFWKDFFAGKAVSTPMTLTPVTTGRATVTPSRTPTRTGTVTGTATRPATGTVTRAATTTGGTRTATAATGTATQTATGTTTATIAGAPTRAQLEQALLVEDDLDFEWYEIDTGTLREQYAAVYADFESFFDEYLTVELHDARNGVPDFQALALLVDLDVNNLTQVSHAGYGTNGVRYRYDYEDDGERWYGEVAAWQQGGVVAAILVESDQEDVCVCDFAKTLDTKLRTVFR